MSVHLHTTIPQRTGKILTELAKTHGSKSRVLEKALETFLRVEEVGSCDECTIKTKITEQTNLREVLDLTSLGRKTLDGLLEVALGDKSFEDFIGELQIESLELIAIIKDSIGWKTPASFQEFKLLLEEIRDLTRLFSIASHNEIDNTVFLRTKVFTKMPEVVAVQVATILEGTRTPFDLRIMGDDIVVKMVRIDTFPLKKRELDTIIGQQIRKRFEKIKPAIFRSNLALVGPGFFHWAQKHLEEPVTDMGAIIEDVRTAINVGELPKDPRDFLKALVSAGIRMNWFKQAKVIEENENILTLAFQSISPAIAKVAANAFSVMLATRGWKLLGYNLEHANGRIKVEFSGLEDRSLLDQLAELNPYQTIVTQFLDMVPVPRTIFESFASKVFETDGQKFDAVYQSAGMQVANAIKMLAQNDYEKARRLAEKFIARNITTLQGDAEVKFVDKEHFTMILRQVEPLLMSSQQTFIESIFRELGYEVSVTALQNLLSFELKHVRKPILEPVSRKIMVGNLVDAMSAGSAEEAFSLAKEQLDKIFPEDYPWTIKEVGQRLVDMYRELDVKIEIEYFEGGFTLKYETCPYYKLVKSGQKTWLCESRRKTIDYIISRVTRGRKGKIKMIKSLLRNEHPCEYAVFLKGFLETD
ncbi:MAG: hypothetical protein NWF11_07370 [Candidatus Bathyarchaeota archaeon]|nr:hypothetical protein [Candidatus Bathyarchaeota archaeon]